MWWWLLVIAGLSSESAVACSIPPQRPFQVSRKAIPGEPPAPPEVAQVVVSRGGHGRAGGRSTSCDDIGWMTFEFVHPPPDGEVGYVFTRVDGYPPLRIYGGTAATRNGRIVWSWLDGMSGDQEPFSFVVNIQTVSRSGARSLPVAVTVTDLGAGRLRKWDDGPFPIPEAYSADCGGPSGGPITRRSLQQGCLDLGPAEAEESEQPLVDVDPIPVDPRIAASLVFIASASQRDDTQAWERLVRSHLEELDGDDTALVTELAVHLSTAGPEAANEAIQLADDALTQSMHWTRPLYMHRVFALNQARTVAANALWLDAQATYVLDGADVRAVQEAEERTREFAREWYRFARMSEQNGEAARQLCVSAGGTQDWCTGAGDD